MDCRSVAASFDWRCLSTPPCPISCPLSKIPYGGLSPVRLQTTTPPEVCLGKPRLKGTRLSAPISPSWLRPTGLPTRSRSSSRCSCHDNGDHESSTGPFLASGYRVRRVISTTTRSARLGATPRFHGTRLYGRPCRSRVLQAGPKSFPALLRYLSNHAVTLTPAGRFGALPLLPKSYQSSPVGPRRDPCISPDSQISRESFRRGSVHVMLRLGFLLAPRSDLTSR